MSREVHLDCRGRPCPVPVIELSKAVEELEPGDTVVIFSDDPAAAADVPAWCRMRGEEYVGETQAPDGVAGYRVRRTG